MKRYLLFFLFPLSVWSQNYSYLAGARSAGLAHTSVTLTDVWAGHHNQAALAFLEVPQAGLSYENRYFLSELAVGNAAFAYPSEWGTMGLVLSYFGFDLYNQSKVGISYSRSFHHLFSFGLQINYEHAYLSEGTNGPGYITYEAGILAQPSSALAFAFHIYNPSRSFKNNDTEDRQPYAGRLGASYRFDDKAILCAEVKKQESLAIRYTSGFEYSLLPWFTLRTGVSLQPLTNTFGVGVNAQPLVIDLAYEYAQVLGNNATFSIRYLW